jgi:hypothetical protein
LVANFIIKNLKQLQFLIFSFARFKGFGFRQGILFKALFLSTLISALCIHKRRTLLGYINEDDRSEKVKTAQVEDTSPLPPSPEVVERVPQHHSNPPSPPPPLQLLTNLKLGQTLLLLTPLTLQLLAVAARRRGYRARFFKLLRSP